MVCLYCGSKLSVSNSRPQKRTNSVWRRRACPNCQAIFTSVESIDPTATLMFQGAGKHLQPFSRDTLFISAYEACRHRKHAASDARHLSDTIISQVVGDKRAATITRQQVIGVATEVLGRFDNAAAVQYSAYHPL